MKKYSIRTDLLLFVLVFLFFVLPPLFSRPVTVSNQFTAWNFPLYQILLALLSLLLFFYYFQKEKKRLPVFPVFMTLGLLFSCSLFCKFLSIIVFHNNDTEALSVISMPKGLLQWIFCLLNFFSAALYEEILYRFYFPDKLYDLLTYKKDWKYAAYVCELVGCLFFAFAHLYMGIISVVNAFEGHIILRLCYKKSKSIWPGIIAHFIYNVISLILL